MDATLSNQELRPSFWNSGRKGSERRQMGRLEVARNSRDWIVDNINWYGGQRMAREDAPGRPGAQNLDYQGSEGE